MQTIIKAKQLTYLHNQEAYIDDENGKQEIF